LSAESFYNPEILHKTAEVLRALHTSGIDTKVPFDVFEMASGYEKIIRDNSVKLFDGYEATKAQIMKIRKRVTGDNVETVPCHNDPLCENWILGEDGKLYLIDWEYAGMNDGMWDIADVSIEAGFNAEYDKMLLSAYLGKEPDIIDEKHFLASKIYVDYLWTLWAKMRVPYDGQPMEDWATERYTRLKGFIEDYKNIK
jgi:thiamine kinase-like enzyme